MAVSMMIDPAASVYNLVRRTKEHSTVVNSLTTMQVVTSEIENVILLDGVRARVFAGFERMSSFLPQLERYRQLAQNAESVYIFATMDVEPPRVANVRFIPVKDNTPFTQEWFLVADSPDYFTALCAEEQTSPDVPRRNRMFEGVWSFDEEIVTILQEWLTHLVHAAPLTESKKRRNYNRQVSLMSRTMTRLVEQMVKPSPGGTLVKPREIHQVLWQQLMPAIQTASNHLPNVMDSAASVDRTPKTSV